MVEYVVLFYGLFMYLVGFFMGREVGEKKQKIKDDDERQEDI